MARLLVRLGGLLLLASVLYLAIAQWAFGAVDNALFLKILLGGGVSVAAGVVLWILGRGAAGLAARSCRRCGRRVKPGRTYCEDHLKEAIDEYRDQQREQKR
jgi:hypothetical protein